MKLEQVVPWGRSLWEYAHMFDLDDATLASATILGVGDGPASFNAEMHARGRRVVSVDPIYVFSGEQIRRRVDETHDKLVTAASENRHLFTWDHLKSPEHMGRARVAAMEVFLADFAAGLHYGRYIPAGLPSLPFPDRVFDLALCSHLLFLYSEQLSAEFHAQSVIEMARVAREVRIFPLLMLGNALSPHLGAVRRALEDAGLGHEVRRVPYEFQKRGNEMLVIADRRG